jgi:hypothetical protein
MVPGRRRLRVLILLLAVAYGLSLAAGVIVGRARPPNPVSIGPDEKKLALIEGVFGRFREPVREGRPQIIALCAALILSWNLLGGFVGLTLTSIFIVPVVFVLVGGWNEGVAISQLHASSPISLLLFLLMAGLEWVTYPLATAAGLNIGLFFLWPHRQGAGSRGSAVKLAWRDAARLYLLIAMILAVQSVAEILYVRKVLLLGGSGIPLEPY